MDDCCNGRIEIEYVREIVHKYSDGKIAFEEIEKERDSAWLNRESEKKRKETAMNSLSFFLSNEGE